MKVQPVLFEDYCKGCGRCVEACPKHCFALGSEINARSGLTPITFDPTECNRCGLCFVACPEPYGLQPSEDTDPHEMFGPRRSDAPTPYDIPGRDVALPNVNDLMIKGTYASAIGALLAGCRHFFGYPITPSTEGAELMAKILPEMNGVFLQACSEVAAVNLMYGCGGAGLPTMTFTSSPGFSLMLEGISYMVGSEVPGVFVNIMRGGPGLGNIAPEQADIKLACHGLGHGNTQAIVLAPTTPQEMLDLTMLAFELTFKYRNPVVVLGDGYLGQITGKVKLPAEMHQPGIPAWAVHGDALHRGNLICSIYLGESDLEAHNLHLNAKYEAMTHAEQRAELFHCDDAEILIVACNTPARMAHGAVDRLRREGHKVGLFRPITLWPFPIDKATPVFEKVRHILVVEASNGQLEDELRLAASHKNLTLPTLTHLRRFGGILPQSHDIVAMVHQIQEVGV
ncbi:MAG: 3-methyl-2-oxobutanoate dehydrogenase subunit VorB [Acidobacteria bacterium]|nr:3-methyl-2-oxobutanoate dehydrogenase subunit VorB [Acidobacteriota bacterium]